MKTKRFLSLMLIMCLCISLIPVNVQAETELDAQTVVNYFNSRVGESYAEGACLNFVRTGFEALGASRSSACCAYTYGSQFITSTSMDNIPLGADVFFGNCGGETTSEHRSKYGCSAAYYGHIGVYVGDGYFVHATGGMVQKTKLTDGSWSSKYRGWGYHGGVVITDANLPVGMVDSVTGGTQSVTVRGWALDRDDTSRAVEIHVYIGSTGIGLGVANQYRPDVNTVYSGVGEYHGYEFTCSIPSDLTGTQTVTVYAIDAEGVSNVALGSVEVYITPDTEAPVISDVQVTDIDNSGYTVTCTVTDNTGVKCVLFPTWTSPEQDDITWGEGSTADGKTYSYRVNIADHNDETENYITHIYAWDHYENSASIKYSDLIQIDTEAPVISDVKVTDITSTGYTVSCTVTDNTGVDRVQFPTWTVPEQDDLMPDWEIEPECSGTKDGDTYTYRVNIADHNNEAGPYGTHIYAYDAYGNYTYVRLTDLGYDDIMIQYTITYDGNGGSNLTVIQKKVHGEELLLSAEKPAREGYLFLGWATSADADTAEYQPGESFAIDADTTLYAVWEQAVARIGDATYKTVSEALAVVKPGETIELMANATAEGILLYPNAEVTLDLAGYTLTADYIVAVKGSNVIDSVGGGLLAVDKDTIALAADNEQIPVWTGSGYVFTEAAFNQRIKESAAEYFVFQFKPSVSDSSVKTYLQSDLGNSDLSVVVHLTWSSNGNTTSMDFTYNTETAQQVFSQGTLTLTVSGITGLEDMTVTAMIVSDSNVIASGETLTLA